jgi:Chitin binding Peritrophin-A domain
VWATPSSASNPCYRVPDATFVPNPDGECDDYFTCLGGVAHPKQCPDGFYFDYQRQMCYHANQVLCYRTRNPCHGQPNGQFVPRPEGGCDAFYGCNNGIGIPLRCSEGFYFDPVLMRCELPDLVDCEWTTTPIIPTAPSTEGTTTIPTAPTSTTAPNTTPTAPTPPTTPVPTTTVPTTTVPTAPTSTTSPSTTSPSICDICQGRPNHTLVPDRTRGCTAFLECMHGMAVWPQVCPAPFYFDYPRQMCNWPEYVDCNSYDTLPCVN